MSASKFSTFDQVGKAEEVSDVISIIAPTETPFQTMIGKAKTRSKGPQWQEDDLDAPADNAHIEGADAPSANQIATVLRQNYVQQYVKTVQVTDLTGEIELYGRDDELAYQFAKKGKEIKRDLEKTLVNVVQTKVAGNESDTPSRMDSVYSMIDASVTSSNSGTGRAVDESLWLDVMETLYDVGGECEVVMIPPKHARKVADFAFKSISSQVARNRHLTGDGKKVTNVVDVYEGPHGTVRVVMNRWQKKFVTSVSNAEHLFFNPDNWKLLTLQPWTRVPLAITGTAERHLLKGTFSLKHLNFKLSGRLADLNNS